MEAGSVAQMSIKPQGSLRAAGAHDETREITPCKWVHPDEDC